MTETQAEVGQVQEETQPVSADHAAERPIVTAGQSVAAGQSVTAAHSVESGQTLAEGKSVAAGP